MAAWLAPGARVTKQMPGRPVALAWASAMNMAEPSWRQTTRWMASRWVYMASMAAKKLSPGTQNTVFTPWASKASISKLAPVGWGVAVMVGLRQRKGM